VESSLGIKSLDHTPEITHLAQMLVQYPKELLKHMAHWPLIRPCWDVRGKREPTRHDIQVLELELLKESLRVPSALRGLGLDDNVRTE
jgi:hypothetical protein